MHICCCDKYKTSIGFKNKYPEIEHMVVDEGETVYLTKNGYGSMAVISLEKSENKDAANRLIDDVMEIRRILNNRRDW